MNVGQLKKLLEKVDDSTLLVVKDHDHAYETAIASLTTALSNKKRHYLYEDHGDSYKDDSDDIRINVVVIS